MNKKVEQLNGKAILKRITLRNKIICSYSQNIGEDKFIERM